MKLRPGPPPHQQVAVEGTRGRASRCLQCWGEAEGGTATAPFWARTKRSFELREHAFVGLAHFSPFFWK